MTSRKREVGVTGQNQQGTQSWKNKQNPLGKNTKPDYKPSGKTSPKASNINIVSSNRKKK